MATDADAGPGLPLGRRYRVRERGALYARDIPGPRGAPTALLLHGWIATGALNWHQVIEPLSKHFRVIAPDLRGHGRGPQSWRRFRLEDCADDAAALLRHRRAGPAVVVGYSMGGPIAQLLWRRHPELVSGLVLCATSDRMTTGRAGQLVFSSVAGAIAGTTRLGQHSAALARWVSQEVFDQPLPKLPVRASRWAAEEMSGHNVRMLMEAGYALSQHDARPWVGGIDVPTAVVLSEQDQAVSPDLQRAMARRIAGASVVSVDDGHTMCAHSSFRAPLLQACRSVSFRVHESRERVPQLTTG